MLKRNVLIVTAAALALIGGASLALTTAASRSAMNEGGIHKIRHVVIIMQENRSFDHLLRHVSRRRRHSDEGRRSHRLRAAAERSVRTALPRYARSQSRRPAQLRRGKERHQRRQDGRLSHVDARQAESAAGVDDPNCAKRARKTRRDGVPRRTRSSELLGVRARFRAARSHVRKHRVVEFAAASVHGVGVVGELSATAGRDELRQRAGVARSAGRHAPPDRHAAAKGGPITRGPISRICSIALTSVGRTTSWRVPSPTAPTASTAAVRDARIRVRRGYGTSCRASTPLKRTANSATSRICGNFTPPQRTARCRASCGFALRTRTANIRPGWSAPAKPT